ncbi:hypothetical protein HGRIS_002081 [Hohenbuehelia grisea]|uniref:Uncharacterized protein n=1 Tax=Hohenbuehelia grisea TaxID=104357 RepID=A0ABR3JKQ4_9AGAR
MHRHSIFGAYRNNSFDGNTNRTAQYPNDTRPYAMDKSNSDEPSQNPSRKRTQKDQDQEDEKAYRKAMENLVQSWMDRLQLISLITTFFASIEAGLLQTTTPDEKVKQPPNRIEEATNASLIGALILHTSAAVISFLAAFFLIRYKVKQAGREEMRAEIAKFTSNSSHNLTQTPASTAGDMARTIDMTRSAEEGKADTTPRPKTLLGTMKESGPAATPPPLVRMSTSREPPILSTNPQLVQVGPFQGNAPTHLLGRCHWLCIQLSCIGFGLALMGIVCYAWTRHPFAVSMFSSVVMFMCLLSGIIIFIWP